jgi:malate permease and related proteins
MNSISTTISLLLLILVGYVFRGKIKNKEQRDGIRAIILGLALPATIFIALLKINFSVELILVPVLALGFNLVVYVLVSKLPMNSFFNIPDNQYRGLILLIPSLAPGLSCFPFILEFSGENMVATAALADLGNKIFVLIIAYVIAMSWFLKVNRLEPQRKSIRLKGLLMSLINEPVNMVIMVAVVMLCIGLGYESLPLFIKMSVDKVSLMMTPLVLLFIGISIQLTWHQVKTIFSFLFLRSGIAFLVSAVLLLILPINDIATALLVVVFPQSAVSFWPYAHMAAVNALSKDQPTQKIFDLDFAMNVLACSMPFSVVLILAIYSSGDFFTGTAHLFSFAGAFLFVAIIPVLIPFFKVQYYARD